MIILKTIPFLGIFLIIQYSYVQPTVASETKYAEMVDAYEWVRVAIEDYYEREGLFGSEVNELMKGTYFITDSISNGSTIQAFCGVVASIAKRMKDAEIGDAILENKIIEHSNNITLASKYLVAVTTKTSILENLTNNEIVTEYSSHEAISINSPNVAINCKALEHSRSQKYSSVYEVEYLGKESDTSAGGTFADVLIDFQNDGFHMEWFWHPKGQSVGLIMFCSTKKGC